MSIAEKRSKIRYRKILEMSAPKELNFVIFHMGRIFLRVCILKKYVIEYDKYKMKKKQFWTLFLT